MTCEFDRPIIREKLEQALAASVGAADYIDIDLHAAVQIDGIVDLDTLWEEIKAAFL